MEIHNPGSSSVNLAGYYLTDDANSLQRWAFPSPTLVPTGGYLVVFASGKDRAVSGAELHTDFKLAASGEYLALVQPDGIAIVNDFAPSYPQQEEDVSYGLRFTPQVSNEESFFPTPTPGAANGNGGPFVREVLHDPLFPSDQEDIVITAEIDGATVAVVAATLSVRVGYGVETALAMHDDGVAPDLQAGDLLWTGSIPASLSTSGQMVRWKVSAQDTAGRLSLAPAHSTSDSAEYFGTVIQDPSVVSPLATIYWFVESPSLAETRNGTRCSLWYDGKFYDNQFCRIRGGSTASYPKKSYKIDFNPGEKFRLHPEIGKMEEINLNSTWSDKSYIRQQLSWETYLAVGANASLSEMIHLRRNGAFRGLYSFVEQVDDEMLDRLDLDPEGALYKMYNQCTSSTNGVEKKTRTWEGNQDLQDLVTGVLLSGQPLETFLFDNADLPAVISYLVGTALITDNDHVHKNYYLYRDSDGDQEWQSLPWDKDLTFGRNYTLGGGVLNDSVWADTDPQCHPLFGDTNHRKVDGYWNRFIDACYRDPRVLQMYTRRLWTVMEEQLQAPGTPVGNLLYEQHIAALHQQLGADVALDVQAWGSPNWGANMNFQQGLDKITQDYLPRRRTHLFQTHLQSGVLPGPPQGAPRMELGAMEPDPLSGEDEEEWLELQNPTLDAVDLSGWTLTGGISFTFAAGTVVPAGESVFLSPELAAFRGRQLSPKGGEGRFVIGPYDGNLRAGEDLFLWDARGALITSNSSSFTFFLSELSSGQDAVFSVAGASANATIYLGMSQSGGGPISTNWGLAALSPPITILPTLSSDGAGTASLVMPVPGGLHGLQLWFQAVDPQAGLISNGETRFLP